MLVTPSQGMVLYQLFFFVRSWSRLPGTCNKEKKWKKAKQRNCHEDYGLICLFWLRVLQQVPGDLLILKSNVSVCENCHTDCTGVGVASQSLLLMSMGSYLYSFYIHVSSLISALVKHPLTYICLSKSLFPMSCFRNTFFHLSVPAKHHMT